MQSGTIHRYLNKRTLILGDVKSGKTARTSAILEAFVKAGCANRIAVVDLAPNPVHGIGGKIKLPADAALLYLTAAIAAPRLMGTDEEDVQRLALENALAIEALFDFLRQDPKEILFVNDASLYLQAGDLDTFLTLLSTASTQLINAYFGRTFADSPLTQREKRLIQTLIKTCQSVEIL